MNFKRWLLIDTSVNLTENLFREKIQKMHCTFMTHNYDYFLFYLKLWIFRFGVNTCISGDYWVQKGLVSICPNKLSSAHTISCTIIIIAENKIKVFSYLYQALWIIFCFISWCEWIEYWVAVCFVRDSQWSIHSYMWLITEEIIGTYEKCTHYYIFINNS
jgi:hypothetical protein